MRRCTVVYKGERGFVGEVFDGVTRTRVVEGGDWYVIHQDAKVTIIPLGVIKKVVTEDVEEQEVKQEVEQHAEQHAEQQSQHGFAVWQPGVAARGRTLLRLEADGRDGVKLIVVDHDGVRRVRGDILTIRANGKMYRIYCVNPEFGLELAKVTEAVVIQ